MVYVKFSMRVLDNQPGFVVRADRAGPVELSNIQGTCLSPLRGGGNLHEAKDQKEFPSLGEGWEREGGEMPRAMYVNKGSNVWGERPRACMLNRARMKKVPEGS